MRRPETSQWNLMRCRGPMLQPEHVEQPRGRVDSHYVDYASNEGGLERKSCTDCGFSHATGTKADNQSLIREAKCGGHDFSGRFTAVYACSVAQRNRVCLLEIQVAG